jgi:hypothetical protein
MSEYFVEKKIDVYFEDFKKKIEEEKPENPLYFIQEMIEKINKPKYVYFVLGGPGIFIFS